MFNNINLNDNYGSYDDLRTEALMDRKNILRQLQ